MLPWLIITWGFKKWEMKYAGGIAVFSAMFLHCQGPEQWNQSPQYEISQSTGLIMQDGIVFSNA